MSVSTRPVGYLLAILLFGLVGGETCAQQVIPRLVRQFRATTGVNLWAGGMTNDARGRLWMATDEGVVCFDGNRFRVFHDPVARKGDYYYHIVPAPDGRLWLKMGRGHSLSYVDPQRERIVRLPDSTRLVRSYLAKYGCHYLFADAQGLLWIGLKKKGLITFNPRTGAIRHVVDRPLDIRGIAQDRQGVIYFTTSDQGLFTYLPQTGRLTNYRHDDRDPTSLSDNATYGVLPRPDGTVLVGVSEDVDLFTPATGTFRSLRLNQIAWIGRHVVDFTNDQQGNTWFTAQRATYCYTRQGVLQWVTLQSNLGEVSGVHAGPGNRLWICAQDQLYAYDLMHLRPGPPLIIQQITVKGSVLTANSPTQSLVYDTTGHPTLTVPENTPFTIDFTLVATKRAQHVRQRLNKYDQHWKIGDVATATDTYQLPAGTYTYIVNRGDDAGNWEPAVSTMTIVVVPPFWKTTPVILVTLLLLGGLGFYLIRAYYRRRKLKQQLAREQLEAANLRYLDEMKTRFFGNVTHEFRTPLTLILHATEQLINRPATGWERERLDTINRNADQLARLITQMLDIAKMDAQKLDVHPTLGDPILFVGRCVDEFSNLASQHRINLTFSRFTVDSTLSPNEPADGGTAELMCEFDDDKLGKIIYNLLSNALKFTPEGGSIRVSSGLATDGQLCIRVQDTGIGIAPDQLDRIFDRFYQADTSATRRYEGTGIGLAYVRELAERLGGRVSVESTPGAGSTFTVTLPMRVATETAPTNPALTPVLSGQPLQPPADAPASATTDNRPLVLIVEDNQELRTYMADQLRSDYQVLEAVDGRAGIEQALATIPDLIVSDVMMPDVDGYTLVERLKRDERTSHIPIMLLTAKSSFNSRMQGLHAGADDYLSKPFSFAELHTRIHNVLLTRRQWQHYLATSQLSSIPNGVPPSPGENPIPDREQQFLMRLRQSILANLTNEAVDVDWLVEQAKMSRTQLHRKLTALTSLSTTGFIHSVRLSKAQELLQTDNDELTVAEVAYRVGYQSPAYFSKVFSDHFGYSPAQTRARV